MEDEKDNPKVEDILDRVSKLRKLMDLPNESAETTNISDTPSEDPEMVWGQWDSWSSWSKTLNQAIKKNLEFPMRGYLSNLALSY